MELPRVSVALRRLKHQWKIEGPGPTIYTHTCIQVSQHNNGVAPITGVPLGKLIS